MDSKRNDARYRAPTAPRSSLKATFFLGLGLCSLAVACAVPMDEERTDNDVSRTVASSWIVKPTISVWPYGYSPLNKWGPQESFNILAEPGTHSDNIRVILGGPWVDWNSSVPVATRIKLDISDWNGTGPIYADHFPLLQEWPGQEPSGAEYASFSSIAGVDGLHEFPILNEQSRFLVKFGQATGVTHQKKHVSFGSDFETDEKPVVFATQVTDNGGDPTVVRVTNVDTEGFDVYLDEAWGGSHKEETVHWVVFERGNGVIDNRAAENYGECVSVYTGSIVTDENPVPLSADDEQAAFYGLQTDNGGDAAQAQYMEHKFCSNCDSVTHFVYVAENGSNGETGHKDEEIGYAIFKGSECWEEVR